MFKHPTYEPTVDNDTEELVPTTNSSSYGTVVEYSIENAKCQSIRELQSYGVVSTVRGFANFSEEQRNK